MENKKYQFPTESVLLTKLNESPLILDYWKEKKLVEKVAKGFADRIMTSVGIKLGVELILTDLHLIEPVFIATSINVTKALTNLSTQIP